MELATLNLDTYKIVKLLQAKGYSEEQAEGLITTLQDITLSGVAAKQDIIDLRNEINNLRTEMISLRTEINDLRNDTLKFQIIQTLTIIGVMVAMFQIF